MRRSAILAVLGALLALPLVATAHQAWAGPELHDERVGVAAPPVVAQALADSADTLDGRPFEVVPLTDVDELDGADAARRAVRDGRLDAAVSVDLRTTTDVLVVATTRTDQYVDALRGRLAPISAGYGRTLEVERVAPDGAVGTASAPGLLAACWCGVGIVVVAGISFARGPVAPTPARGVGRLLVVLAAGAVSGVVSALVVEPGDPFAAVTLVPAAVTTVGVTGCLVLAAESLLELEGLGVAVALMIAPALPLVSGVTPDLLAEPWHTLETVAPQDAAWRVARAALGHTDRADGSWALLAAWGAIALLTLSAARTLRPTVAARARTARATAT